VPTVGKWRDHYFTSGHAGLADAGRQRLTRWARRATTGQAPTARSKDVAAQRVAEATVAR
jgi:hypothetical protein